MFVWECVSLRFQSRWHKLQDVFQMGIHITNINHLLGNVPFTLKPL